MRTEPVMTMVLALIGAAGVLLTAFGVHVTEAQTAAIGGFVIAALTLGLYVRSRVSPVKASRRRRRTDLGLTLLEVLVLLLLVLVILLLIRAIG